MSNEVNKARYIVLSEDGTDSKLIRVSRDGIVRIILAQTNTTIDSFTIPNMSLSFLSKDMKYLLVKDDTTYPSYYEIYDINTKTKIDRFQDTVGVYTPKIAFNSPSDIWILRNGGITNPKTKEAKDIQNISPWTSVISPDGRYAAHFNTNYNDFYVWDLLSQKLLTKINIPLSQPWHYYTAIFTSDSSRVLLRGNTEETVYVFDIETAAMNTLTISSYANEISRGRFADEFIATYKGYAEIYDVNTGSLKRRIQGNPSKDYYEFKFSTSGIFGASSDDLWLLNEGEERVLFEINLNAQTDDLIEFF